MSLSELAKVFPPHLGKGDRDDYALFALAALWITLPASDRHWWWTILSPDERRKTLEYLKSIRRRVSFRSQGLKLFKKSQWYVQLVHQRWERLAERVLARQATEVSEMSEVGEATEVVVRASQGACTTPKPKSELLSYLLCPTINNLAWCYRAAAAGAGGDRGDRGDHGERGDGGDGQATGCIHGAPKARNPPEGRDFELGGV